MCHVSACERKHNATQQCASCPVYLDVWLQWLAFMSVAPSWPPGAGFCLPLLAGLNPAMMPPGMLENMFTSLQSMDEETLKQVRCRLWMYAVTHSNSKKNSCSACWRSQRHKFSGQLCWCAEHTKPSEDVVVAQGLLPLAGSGCGACAWCSSAFSHASHA